MKRKILAVALVSSVAMAGNFYVGGGVNALGAEGLMTMITVRLK